MSTLRVNTLQNAAGTGQPAMSGAAKAWVNFNGTGTVAIRASFNVTSITDNGTGDYTVNFTNALEDANYSYAGNCNNASNLYARNVVSSSGTHFTTSSLRIGCFFTGDGALTDSGSTTIAVFR